MRHKPAYRPAELVQGATRWYIKVYAPNRERLTFGLNRIHDLNLRRQRGEEIVFLINWWLAADLPLNTFDERIANKRRTEARRAKVAPRGHTPIVTALYQAVEIKGAKTRENSSNSYRSHANVFINYLEKAELETMPVDELEVYHVVDFMDHRKLNDKVRNNTVNNDIIHLGALFTELKERGFVLENVWHQVKKLPKERKHRRAFEPDEAQVTIRHFYRHDPTLCLAILFQYCCFLRPNEIRQLKISDVDLDTGIIQVRPETGKTSKELHTRYATIPASYEPIFRELMPVGARQNYIFGVGFKPGSAPCSKNRMYRRHKRGLKWLHDMGKLPDLKGLEFYSWKDTGITDAADMLPIVFVQDQAGHTDTKTTLMYRKRPKVNHHFRDMEKKLLL